MSFHSPCPTLSQGLANGVRTVARRGDFMPHQRPRQELPRRTFGFAEPTTAITLFSTLGTTRMYAIRAYITPWHARRLVIPHKLWASSWIWLCCGSRDTHTLQYLEYALANPGEAQLCNYSEASHLNTAYIWLTSHRFVCGFQLHGAQLH